MPIIIGSQTLLTKNLFHAKLCAMENFKACTIQVDAEMHKRLKARAALEDTSISQLINEALVVYLSEPSNIECSADLNGSWLKAHAARLAVALLTARNALTTFVDAK